MDGLEYLQQVFDDGAAYVAYRTGSFVCGEFLRVRDGRIAEISVTFSPTV